MGRTWLGLVARPGTGGWDSQLVGNAQGVSDRVSQCPKGWASGWWTRGLSWGEPLGQGVGRKLSSADLACPQAARAAGPDGSGSAAVDAQGQPCALWPGGCAFADVAPGLPVPGARGGHQ